MVVGVVSTDVTVRPEQEKEEDEEGRLVGILVMLGFWCLVISGTSLACRHRHCNQARDEAERNRIRKIVVEELQQQQPAREHKH